MVSIRFSGYEKCPVELGATTPRRGVNPLDRAKWILHKRNALT
jgi:ribosomal protection tetracycline resistance protein